MADALADLASSYLGIDRAIEAPEHLHEDLHREGPEDLLLLCTDHRLVLIARELAVRNL